MDRLTVEQLDKMVEGQPYEWLASKRELAKLLADTMRENLRMLNVIKEAVDNRGDQGSVLQPLMNYLNDLSNKESDNA